MHPSRASWHEATFAARLPLRPERPKLSLDGRTKGRGERFFSGGWGAENMEANQTQPRRAVSAAVIGNVLEWYDFAVYAYVAVYIAKNFFPQGDPTTALLATFLTYGLGFLARPLGGIILGRVGDTHG